MKWLTFDIPEFQHRSVQMKVVSESVAMVDMPLWDFWHETTAGLFKFPLKLQVRDLTPNGSADSKGAALIRVRQCSLSEQ